MNTALFIFIILLLILLLLLAIPVSLSFFVSNDQDLPGYVHVRWFFGLVDFRIPVPAEHLATSSGNSTESFPPPKQKPRPIKKKSVKTRINTRGLLSLFTQSAFRQHLTGFIKKMLRAMHAHNFYLRLRLGLGDPADTGLLWAAIGPISAMLANIQFISINIEPEFVTSVFEFKSHGNFHFIPLQFVLLTLGFLLSPTTIRAWRLMHRPAY